MITPGTFLVIPRHGRISRTFWDDHALLMSRLWDWMGTDYLFCGRDNKNYIKRGVSRHVNGDIPCRCGWSESWRWLDMRINISSDIGFDTAEYQRATDAWEKAEKEEEAQNERVRKRKAEAQRNTYLEPRRA